MKILLKLLRPAFTCLLVMTFICGFFYTGVVTGIAQLAFPYQANGSIITVTLDNGETKSYGSELIEQEFTKPEYLIGRPMEVSNLSPVSDEQTELVNERVKWWRDFDPDNNSPVPMDLVTASGSGYDPHISPDAAEYQALRIANARGVSEAEVLKIIEQYTSKRFLGFIGEEAVNVLLVNLKLDGILQ